MYKLLLCLRYLRTRYIALASVVSVTLGVATMIVVNSVMAGFGSEMRNRIKGILSDIVVETNSINGESDPEAHKALVRKVCGDRIAGMAATVEIYGMVSFQYAGQWITRPVTLIGIDPASKAEVGPLVSYLQSYQAERDGKITVKPAERNISEPPGWDLTPDSLQYRKQYAERQAWFQQQVQDRRVQPVAAGGEPSDADPERKLVSNPETEVQAAPANPFDQGAAPVVVAPEEIGKLLKGRLYIGAGLVSFPYEDQESGKVKTHWMVRAGDDVRVSTVTAGTPNPVHFNATVVDTFKSGMSEYDSTLVFCNLDYLQEVRGMIDPQSQQRAITSIQLKLTDFKHADEVVRKLRDAFPPGLYSVKTWEQKQGPLLAAVDVESSILNVLLFLIIAVAGFGILAIFYMIVVEKTRDIGILKALGASSNGVMSIFLSYGLSLGIVGSGVGVIVGLLFVRYINTIEAIITFLTGRKVFDERIYYFPSIPTHVNPWMVGSVAFGAMMIAVMASILPARRAARLKPVESLRYE